MFETLFADAVWFEGSFASLRRIGVRFGKSLGLALAGRSCSRCGRFCSHAFYYIFCLADNKKWREEGGITKLKRH